MSPGLAGSLGEAVGERSEKYEDSLSLSLWDIRKKLCCWPALGVSLGIR